MRSAALPAALARRAPMLARTWVSALPEPMSNHLASGSYRRRIIEKVSRPMTMTRCSIRVVMVLCGTWRKIATQSP